MNENKKLQKEFALVERHHLVRGLFQTVPSGIRKSQSLELSYDLPNGGKLEIIAPQALRPFDALLLCTVLCKAAQKQLIIYPDAKGKGKTLRDGLQLMQDSVQKECLAYETTARQLIENMGLEWKGSITLKQIEDSVKRMFFAGFVVKRRIKGELQTDMYHLISYAKLRDSRNTISIGINPLLSEALIAPAHYARIDIEILRSLDPVKQLLYIMLCNTVDANNKVRKIGNETLREMLYGPANNLKPATYRQQKSRSRRTTIELVNKLSLSGWQIDDSQKDVVLIKRRKQQRNQTSKNL